MSQIKHWIFFIRFKPCAVEIVRFDRPGGRTTSVIVCVGKTTRRNWRIALHPAEKRSKPVNFHRARHKMDSIGIIDGLHLMANLLARILHKFA